MRPLVLDMAVEPESIERAAAAVVSAGDARPPVRFVASTSSLDRFESRIVPSGIQLAAYRNNPIVLWNHDLNRPIARALNVELSGGRLMADAQFPAAGVDPEADRIYALVRAGIVNAASVRLRPVKSRAGDDPRSRIYEESELLELSIVSVPGNAEALIVARDAGPVDHSARHSGANSTTTGVHPMNLQELQRQRDHIVSQHSALSDISQTRALTDDEMATLAGYQTSISDLDRRIDQLRTIEAQRATIARPVDSPSDVQRAAGSLGLSGGRVSNPMPMARRLERGEGFGLIVRALCANRGIPQLAAAWVERETGQMEVARALASSVSSAGGVLVATQFSTEFIELLRPASVVRSAGPRMMTFAGAGAIAVPRQSGGATASYIGENQRIQYSELTTDGITITPKKIAAITALSNELIRRSNPAADQLVRDDLVNAVAQVSDAQFLRGAGSATSPTGLAAQALVGNIIASAGTTAIDDITTELQTAILKLVAANVRMTRPTWFMSPITISGLSRIRNAAGGYVWRDEIRAGTLEGFALKPTTQIPANLGTGSNESQVIFADMGDVVLAEEEQVTVDVSQEAAYVDGSNNMISAFSHDQTVVRVIATHDLALRHPAAVSVISGVKW